MSHPPKLLRPYKEHHQHIQIRVVVTMVDAQVGDAAVIIAIIAHLEVFNFLATHLAKRTLHLPQHAQSTNTTSIISLLIALANLTQKLELPFKVES